MKFKLPLLALAAALFFSTQASATSIGIATFLDNQGPVLEFTDLGMGAGSLTTLAGAEDIRLRDIQAGNNRNASFTVTDTMGGALDFMNGVSESGVITFIRDNNAATVLLKIEFDQASFSTTNFGGTETPIFSFDLTSDIAFTGSIIDSLMTPIADESFSFALTLTSIIDNQYAFDAAFTSSATPVPVPAALPLMLSGLLGGLLFGRKKAKA